MSNDLAKLTSVLKGAQAPASEHRSTESTMPIDKIQDRAGGDTRELNQNHVEELAESIAVLGLIEPVVVDKQGKLLAGGHRRAALHLVREKYPDDYQRHFSGGQIPVRVMPIDSEQELDLALAIETAENEKRRDYTAAEVKAIAEKLRMAGYEEVKGRPKKDQKPLMPALSVVVGKHLRTIQRYLYEESEKSATSVVLSNPKSERDKLVRQAIAKLNKWDKTKPSTKKEKALVQRLPEILELLNSVLDDDDL